MRQVLRDNDANLCHYHANLRHYRTALCVNGTILGENGTAVGAKDAVLCHYCPSMRENMPWSVCK